MKNVNRKPRNYMMLYLGIGAVIGTPLGFSFVPICGFIFQVIQLIILLPGIIAVASAQDPELTRWNVFFNLLDKHSRDSYVPGRWPHIEFSQIESCAKGALYGYFLQFFGSAFLAATSEIVYAFAAYIGTAMLMCNVRLMRKMIWSLDIDTQYISSRLTVQFMEFPSLARKFVPVKAVVKLLSCPPGAHQAALASAISDRRSSLYLVSADAVIPVCYDLEENEQAIDQLRTKTFLRDIPVVTLEENPMPEPASGVVLALWAVGLLVGFYFGLGQLYHLAHGNPQVTKQTLPLISILCTWGVLEVYSVVLRRRGYARIRKAVGL